MFLLRIKANFPYLRTPLLQHHWISGEYIPSLILYPCVITLRDHLSPFLVFRMLSSTSTHFQFRIYKNYIPYLIFFTGGIALRGHLPPFLVFRVLSRTPLCFKCQLYTNHMISMILFHSWISPRVHLPPFWGFSIISRHVASICIILLHSIVFLFPNICHIPTCNLRLAPLK